MITIGITSFNRGKYLRSLLTSLKDECLQGQHQVILVDNFSSEPRVFDAIGENLDWIEYVDRSKSDQVQNWVNDEYIAKNTIISKAKSDVILFLQDDLQYVGPHDMIEGYANVLRSSDLLCLTANAVRKSTVNSLVKSSHHTVTAGNHLIYEYGDQHFHTMGFFKKAVFTTVGQYPVSWPAEQSYWGRSEDVYDQWVKEKSFSRISGFHSVPIFVPVWNDPRGGYAFFRAGNRYGFYHDPVESTYYQKFSTDEWYEFSKEQRALSMLDVAKPLGWKLRVEGGDVVKYPQSKVMIEGPIAEIEL